MDTSAHREHSSPIMTVHLLVHSDTVVSKYIEPSLETISVNYSPSVS